MKATLPTRFFPALFSGVLLLAIMWVSSTEAVAQNHRGLLAAQEVLQSCRMIPDKELRDLRGRFDTSFFGLDIVGNLNVGSGAFNGQVAFSTNVAPENVNFSGTQVSYDNGNISYQAGIGANSFGSGIYSMVVVAGTQNIVIANTNIILNIQGLTMPSFTGLSTPATRVAIR